MSESMIAPTRGVPLTLNGQEYRLRYSMLRLRQIREALGGSVLTDGVTDERLIDVLWFGLGGEQSPLSKEELADAVDLENMSEVVQALQKAMGMKPAPLAAVPPAPPAPTAPALVVDEPQLAQTD